MTEALGFIPSQERGLSTSLVDQELDRGSERWGGGEDKDHSKCSEFAELYINGVKICVACEAIPVSKSRG